MAGNKITYDNIPLGAGQFIVTKINSDGSEGQAMMFNYDYAISSTITSTKNEETLTNGNGSDKPFALDQTWAAALTTNTFNEQLHSFVTNRDYTPDATEMMFFSKTVNIVEIDSAEPKTYGYKFGDTNTKVPAADAVGNYKFAIKDSYGRALVDTSSAATPVADGQFKYDADTKTIYVTAENVGLPFTVGFWYSATVTKSSADSIPVSQEFKLEILSKTQSVATGVEMQKLTKITRCILSGDTSEMPTQKEKNTNFVYNFTSTAAPIGQKPFETFLCEADDTE